MDSSGIILFVDSVAIVVFVTAIPVLGVMFILKRLKKSALELVNIGRKKK
jgi:hypothetical protein